MIYLLYMGNNDQALLILSTAIGLIAYLPSIVSILKNRISPSFCTWSLWTLLNIIVLIGLIKNNAPYTIAIAYTIGTSIISLLVLFKRQFSWNNGDTLISILILISGIFLFLGSPSIAIVVGSIASFIAGIPEMRKAFHNPRNVSRLTASLFIVANTLLIVATNKLILVNTVYPLSWIFYWVINLTISFQKK